jgi:hypothetical protein
MNKPGDTHLVGNYEFTAHTEIEGCYLCVGKLHTDVCHMLPVQCGSDQLIWMADTETEKLIRVVLKLEGKIDDD